MLKWEHNETLANMSIRYIYQTSAEFLIGNLIVYKKHVPERDSADWVYVVEWTPINEELTIEKSKSIDEVKILAEEWLSDFVINMANALGILKGRAREE